MPSILIGTNFAFWMDHYVLCIGKYVFRKIGRYKLYNFSKNWKTEQTCDWEEYILVLTGTNFAASVTFQTADVAFLSKRMMHISWQRVKLATPETLPYYSKAMLGPKKNQILPDCTKTLKLFV